VSKRISAEFPVFLGGLFKIRKIGADGCAEYKKTMLVIKYLLILYDFFLEKTSLYIRVRQDFRCLSEMRKDLSFFKKGQAKKDAPTLALIL